MYNFPEHSSHQAITLTPGLLIANRYKVLQLMGRGGFGRTYLAEDQNRFNECCVLKEFAPQLQNEAEVQKAQALFEQEAGVLYRLEHPQIPKFREFLRTHVNGHYYLLLVQDYVKGISYRDLLQGRTQAGQLFSEVEALQLLWGVLPVLTYLHSCNVIHRDISPDNLILREQDGLPVLIDFGGVKLVMLTILSQVTRDSGLATTVLGKVGYAPSEQMQQGVVSPSSDLYGLAMTTLVLLTGQEPQLLRDPSTLSLQWQRYTHLSPGLAQVLERMLEIKPRDRFQSAEAVLAALSLIGSSGSPAMPGQPGVSSMIATQVVVPVAKSSTPPYGVVQQASKSGWPWGCLLGSLIGTGVAFGVIALGLWGIPQLSQISGPRIDDPLPPPPTQEPFQQFSAEEIQRKAKLDSARSSLGINQAFLIN